jgi:nitrous oxide reductase accessory protein NosL
LSEGLAGRALMVASRIVATLFLLLITASAALAQTTVTAQWDRNTDSQTAGYRLYYGTAPGSYQWSVDAGNQTSAPITLSSGSVYYFTVRAYDANFEFGAPSNEASIDIAAGGGGAAAPTAHITATMQSSNTALVSWYTTNAVSASINGTPLNAASGSASVQVADTTTFTLVVTGASGAVATHSATVTLSAPTSAPTAQITAALGANNYVTVSWQTTNATSTWITANGTYYAVGPSGSAGLTVSGPTTFTLHAQGADGRTVTSVATVGGTQPGESSAPTAHITATLGDNNYVTVSWQTANATSTWITANGAYYAVGASGSAGITVSGPTTFTLNAQAADGRRATSVATVGSTQPGNGAPTAEITSTLGDNNYVTVTWRTSNASSIWITANGTYYAVGPSGSAGITVTGPTTFVLTSQAPDGRSTTATSAVSP